MAPTRVGDFSKKANDLLTNDYCFDRKFKLTVKHSGGVTFTQETLVGKSFDAKLTAKFAVMDGVSVEKATISNSGRFQGEMTVKFPAQNTDVVLKMEEGGGKEGAGSFEFKHSQNKFTFDNGFDVASTALTTSGSFAVNDQLVVGGSVKVDTRIDAGFKGAALKDFGVSAVFTDKGKQVSLVTKEKLQNATLSLHGDLDKKTVGAAQVTVKNFDFGGASLALGAIYSIDDEQKIQAKVDNKGVISANYILQLRPQIKGILSAQVDAKNAASDTSKFGVSMIIG